MKLTKKEDKAISALEKVSKNWPKSLWLYSASGTLWVMRYNDKGKTAILSNGSVDPDYCITSISIDNDGGDW